MSYSQIKQELQVSKSTLSNWLGHMPLSPEAIHQLRDLSEIRIEKYKATREVQRTARRQVAYDSISKTIGELSDRDMFIAGLFLYWGEGGKTDYTSVSISNTDPAVLCFFKKWIEYLGADPHKMRVRLQLYSDMEPKMELAY